MILTPQYGFRSSCCYAPIKLGRKKVKNTNIKVDIWICCSCKKRDVPLVKYNKELPSRQNAEITSFAPEIEVEDENDPDA